MKKLRKRELAASSLSKEGSGRACCIFRINASNALEVFAKGGEILAYYTNEYVKILESEYQL